MALTLVDNESISSDFWHSWFFLVAQLPLYGLVLFGSYALVHCGYHLFVLEDCNAAQQELVKEIEEARTELKRKGVKL